jgi:undecaprenyl-diphosphatase
VASVLNKTLKPRAAAASILVWFAVLIGLVVASGELLHVAERADGATGFDSSITSWVVAHRTHVLTSIARGLSTIGSQAVLTPLVAVTALWLLVRRRAALAVVVLCVWGGAIGLYSLAKLIVNRPRPPSELWLTSAGGNAFPSGHAVQSLATYAVLVAVAAVWLRSARRPGIAAAVVLGLAVGWSRVYLGVHWATDVIAGWIAGAAWVAVVVWLARAAWPAPSGVGAADGQQLTPAADP